MKRYSAGVLMLALAALLGPLTASAKLPPCPPGWDQRNWADPEVQTPKYKVGRILAAFPHTPDGLKQALPAVKALYPGSKIVAGTPDILYVAGVGDIDVIAGAATGGRAWRWYVLRDECAKSGLCSPPHRGPAAPGGSASSRGGSSRGGGGGGSSSGGQGANGRFTCNKWADNRGCWCGEWTDAIWAQRHYVATHQCRPGFTLNGHPDSRWGQWANEEVGQFISHMENVLGGSNQDCLTSAASPDWNEVERKYWIATAFSGFSGTGLGAKGSVCSGGGGGGGAVAPGTVPVSGPKSAAPKSAPGTRPSAARAHEELSVPTPPDAEDAGEGPDEDEGED